MKHYLLKQRLFLISAIGLLVTICSAETITRPLPLPGSEVFPMKLTQQFEKMNKFRGAEYKPRTRHINADSSAKYTNRLFLESSPYLLQHAHNPVNWYPWGDEAFETAKRLSRPVLLSIGYSTCHWCHVMEEESFEDEEIARYLNENYIAIKADREERPDIDAIYMSAVQALTGSGGWPMTVWLTSDRKPFYGGTYFPARDGDRGASMGFLTLIRKLKTIYDSQPDQVIKGSQQITAAIQEQLVPKAGDDLPNAKVLHDAIAYYEVLFDPTDGGVAGAPKFPSSFPVRLLFRYHRRTGDAKVLHMAKLTLEKMAAGGIYDQAGGGFHRYSTDKHWLAPHFEKMLYDNALLIMAYLEGWQATGDADFKRVVKNVLRYVKRDMTSPEGAFYSATDADSLTPEGHREEGYFFTWTPAELVNALGRADAKVVSAYYAVQPSGNFEGRSILHIPQSPGEIAQRLGISQEELSRKIVDLNERLYKDRQRRPPPLRDEKILTAWNGLMISAHAQAGFILGDSDYIDRAARAAQFILEHLFLNERLYRSYKDGRARHNAYLDDYSFLIAGLLDLFEATHDPAWLEKAISLDEILEKYYEDKKNGAFFMTGNDHEALIAREKPVNDGAVPSGNSVAILNLLRLNKITTKDRYRKRAEKGLTSFSQTMSSSPAALSEMLLAVDFFLDTPKEIIIVTPQGTKDKARPFLTELRNQFLPNRMLVVVSEGLEMEAHAGIIPLVQSKIAQNGKATAYVCEEGVCKLPTTDSKVFAQQIKSSKKLTGRSDKK